jgi:hypothetical protein
VRKIAEERSRDNQLNHELHVLEQSLKNWFFLVENLVDNRCISVGISMWTGCGWIVNKSPLEKQNEKLLNLIQSLYKTYPQVFNEGKMLINKWFFSYPQIFAALLTTTINIYTYK